MTQKAYVVIRGFGSVSALGHSREAVRLAYHTGKPAFQMRSHNGVATPVSVLQPESEIMLANIQKEKKAYQLVDRSVLMAILASRQAVSAAGWKNESAIAINIGSSRGATSLFEKYFKEFQETGIVPPQASPLTTLGNISSWVAQDLKATGPDISHSVTCSTGLQAIANGFAWLKAGMISKFLAGAAEAPLTPFTLAQMKAIGIYAAGTENQYPCRPLNAEKKNTFVLGEGAAVFALEKISEQNLLSLEFKPVVIESIGFGFEAISSKTGISKEGAHFSMAVADALQKAANPEPIDLVIMHAPGTVAGDMAELKALEKIFKTKDMPVITSLKWLVGHTLGASAGLSLDYALHILTNQSLVDFPYPTYLISNQPKSIKRIMIMAAGFGGNAAAMIISQPT